MKVLNSYSYSNSLRIRCADRGNTWIKGMDSCNLVGFYFFPEKLHSSLKNLTCIAGGRFFATAGKEARSAKENGCRKQKYTSFHSVNLL